MKKIYKTSSDAKCKFYPKKHKYKIGKKELTSVTTFLKQFFSEFDANKMSKVKAFISKRDGRPEENATFWKKKWKESAEHGTRVHALIEQWTSNPKQSIEEAMEGTTYQEPRDLAKAMNALNWLYYSYKCQNKDTCLNELLVYDPKLGVAGQVDLVTIKDNVVDIIDFKSNDKITTEGYRGAKAKEPLKDLPDCSLTKYSLQVSLYARMLESLGYKVGKLTILHIKEIGVVPYNVDYTEYSKYIDKIIKYKENKEKELI